MSPPPSEPAAVRGPHNDITDVSGVMVGHHQRRGRGWLTGTTVVLVPPGSVAGVDVRGGGPGTRETDALSPINLVDTADGVMAWLAERNRGFRVGPEQHHVVPIVPTAVLFDLGAGGRFANRPDATFGARAVAAARPSPVRQGTVGAGTGAHAQLLKGGIGSASVVLANGVTVAALVALNSSGSVVDPRSGRLWGLDRGLCGEFADVATPSRADLRRHGSEPPVHRPLNTTLAVLATNAAMAKHELTRMAGCGHDGMARAIDPIHQYVDGDVVFAVSTGEVPVPPAHGAPEGWASRPVELTPILAAAADCVTRAIVHAALAATSAGTMASYRDRFPSAFR